MRVAYAIAVVAALPIVGGPTDAPRFSGDVAKPQPVTAPEPPRHPHMAPNGRSNLHDDAYQTDAYRGTGPLGVEPSVSSALYVSECGSVTFDSRDRIVTVCVGVVNVTLRVLDPRTLDTIASLELPARDVLGGGINIFQNFSGGGYFYLDDRDRAVIPTTERHVVIVATSGASPRVEREYDLTAAVPAGDAIISALPDWAGRIWFASRNGVVGTIDPADGAVRSMATGEPIGNSFAVDETGGVYIVTDAALYRFDAGPDGTPAVTWRETYANTGAIKPGQTQAGSGTTPTLMGSDLVAITDNADPMAVDVFRRARTAGGARRVCRAEVFERGASATDNSLITDGKALVVENNYGYSGPLAVQGGASTAPGVARVDVDRARGTCTVRWTSGVRAPSVVPKLALASGLVYTYTKDVRGDDAWFFTALDFATGRTVYRVLAGEGLGFNNNYAPVTIGPDGTAYVGVLGGITAIRDKTPPQLAPAPEPKPPGARRRRRLPAIAVRCAGKQRLTVTVRGSGVRSVATRGRRDRRRPFSLRLRRPRTGRTLLVTVRRDGASTVRRRVRLPRC